ncbi:lipase family protein [Raoultella terrigena]|uniref:lipase family protein n=1 Tax=Raoultella terrigena TaxID=577 RepID=UPI001430FE36|nr:lipase family protein [Raoultella terrigena]QIT27724.1 lipase family protein [Raoultella terrigena]
MSTATTSLECKYPDAWTGKQKKYWVEIQLLDEREDHIPNMPYVAENAATRSQCVSYTGKSDANGIIRIEGLHPLELILHIEAKPLADEMEKRALRPFGRSEDDSTVKPKAAVEGYEYRYLKIGQLCDTLPEMMPEWKDKANPPEYHFPDGRFAGQTIKKLNCRYVFEVCPFRAWSLMLHHQTDYSIVNAYNLGIMADLSYSAEEQIIRYFEQECVDLSAAPKLSDEHDYYAVVKDVPFSRRYINPRFVTTAGSFIQYNTQLFYVSNGEHVIVAWRGTQEVRDWVTDITFSPQECPSYLAPTGKIHKGFLDAFEYAKEMSPSSFDDIKSFINEKKQLFLCGHSLGGALALIYAAELKPIKPLLYTYGMPRVFTADAILQLADITHYRHVNDSDTITSVPMDVNLYNWFYEIYGPVGSVLGTTWSVAELLSQKITGITVGDCFWHHGDIVLFYYTTQVVESLQCEGSMSAPKCRRIKYRLPKKTKYYLIPSLAEEKSISAKNQEVQFIRSLTPDSLKQFFPKNTNPDLDSILTDPRNHFMPAAYLPYINDQLVELVCPDAPLKRKESRAAFEKQLSDAGIPDNEKERNRLFAALQRLVVETLRVTELMPEGKPALERFRKTKKEYVE